MPSDRASSSQPLHRVLLWVCPLFLLVAACGGDKGPPPEPGPRPVSVLELRAIDPVTPLRLTGVVESWREEDVAFEVGGRVSYVVEAGLLLDGRWEEGGEVNVVGDVASATMLTMSEPY